MTEKQFKSELERIGKRIKDIRNNRRLKQIDLEIKTNIYRSDISKIENGHSNLEYFTIVRIAEALDVHPSELIIPNSKFDKK